MMGACKNKPEPELSKAALAPQVKRQRTKPSPADTQRLALKLAFRGLCSLFPAAYFQQQSTKNKRSGQNEVWMGYEGNKQLMLQVA